MTTVPSSPRLIDLQVGATPILPNSSETMLITMKTRKVDPNDQVLNTGGTYTVPRSFGILAVESGWATENGTTIPSRNGQRVNPNVISATSFTYDGSNRLTSFMADGIFHSITYPDSTTINIYRGAEGRQITLNASQLVTAIADL